MKLGVSANYVWFGPPITDTARMMEDLGFESLWMGEHIIIPVNIADPNRFGVMLPENYKHMPDPLISLTAAAIATKNLKLGTNICLVPQRHPLVLAKTISTLDRISGGRFFFGIGAGWIEEEMTIMGFPRKARWPKTTEYLRALKALWTEEKASFEGEHISFPEVYSNPKPLQQPHPPILIGAGNDKTENTPILKRVADIGDGWQPSFLSPAQMREQLKELKQYCDEKGRDFSKMDITLLVPAINLGVGDIPSYYEGLEVKPANASEMIAEYEEAGVNRLLVGLDDMIDEATTKKHLETAAKGLGLI